MRPDWARFHFWCVCQPLSMERALRREVVTMPHGSYWLGETAAKEKMVRLVCDKCGRRGQYRIDRLLEQYGPDIAMPDLHHELAQYLHRRDAAPL